MSERKRKRASSLTEQPSEPSKIRRTKSTQKIQKSEKIQEPPKFAYSAPSLSHIKHKNKRVQLHAAQKKIKSLEKKKRKIERKKEKEILGDAAPKRVPRTLENTREADDTFVNPDDEEVKADVATDEFAAYFENKLPPKILITTSPDISSRGKETRPFVECLVQMFPNTIFRDRRNYTLKEIVSYCIQENFTDIIVINEDMRQPNSLLLCHLPEGPTALFKLTSVVLPNRIHNHAAPTDHFPELILNNFSTRLGHSVGRMLSSMVPPAPEFEGRRVMTFHNQRDFIFFRQHRYIFDSLQKARLQEIGPRFTLKLKYLQHGTFDSKFGEYEWLPKKELVTSRRRFFL